ncbi:MAG: type IV pilus twitching motility protein PilT [Dissulfurispiraceae bacterium]|jgi:twitching motility protein PilT|nr:type IV pilus twitching motility protein PilT [Dissulfurispiraceae bacterium]
MDINRLLTDAFTKDASDIHLRVGSRPVYRINGELVMDDESEIITPETARSIADLVMGERERGIFESCRDADFAYSIPGAGRFRCNIFMQRGTIGLVFRTIPFGIPDIASLHLPQVISDAALSERGLVLVTGATGSGKTTTLASMINHINSSRSLNIVTIEDPIEYLHKDIKSIITQREVGGDTASFNAALRAALRQDPDVIFVGEMRDSETIETAITAAETGHLVLSTLHTVDATETINRIISSFPTHIQHQIRRQLSSVLRAVISQRLLPRADARGRVPAVEVMLATDTVKACILDPEKTNNLKLLIREGKNYYNMQTFDQSLYDLHKQGLITYEEAIRHSTSPKDLELRMKGVE